MILNYFSRAKRMLFYKTYFLCLYNFNKGRYSDIFPERWFLKQHYLNFWRKSSRNSLFSFRNVQETSEIYHKNPLFGIRLSILTKSCLFQMKSNNVDNRICLSKYCFHKISGIKRNQSFPCRIIRSGSWQGEKDYYKF